MNSTEKLTQIALHERQAAGNFTFDFTVGIFSLKLPCPNGTGVLTNICGRKFVITAAHVLDLINPQFMFLTSSPTPTLESPKILKSGRCNNGIDIGYLEISLEGLQHFKKRFLTLDQIEYSYLPKNTDWLCLTGFPNVIKSIQQNFLERTFFIEGNALSLWCDYVSPDQWRVRKWDSRKNLVIYYPEEGYLFEKEKHIKNPHPGGISGCGMWKVPINPNNLDSLWDPNQIRLIGIEHCWDSKERQICSTKIEYFLDLVKQDYGFTF